MNRRSFLVLLFWAIFVFPIFAKAEISHTFLIDQKRGDTSIEVKFLQQYLNTHGFVLTATGPGSPGQETFFFGELTYNALVKFQEAHAQDILAPLNLTKGTGILGPYTRFFINKRIKQSVVKNDIPDQIDSNIHTVSCSAPAHLTCIPGTSIIQPLFLGPDWVPGYGQGSVISNEEETPAITVSISPTTATINTSATTTFVGTVTNASDDSVTWSASGGSIDSGGIFTAPVSSLISATTTYTVTATSVEDTGKTSEATVIVRPVIVRMGTASTTVVSGNTVTFTATTVNATSSSVTWSASGGSINSNGLFTAPGVLVTTSYLITASSTIDNTKAATTTIEVTPNENFVGWWKLNEGSGTTVVDSSGNERDGSWSGTASGDSGYYHTDGAPGFDYSGSFSNGDDVVTIADVDIGEAKTFALWVYLPDLSGTEAIVAKSTSGSGVEIIVHADTIRFYVMGSDVVNASVDASDITLNAWNHIVATYNGAGTTMRMYVNGASSGLTATAPGTIGVVDTLRFGDWANGDRDFNGRINDVRMYDVEFTAQEVEDLYDSLVD